MTEEWRTIPNHPYHYVSSLGRIRQSRVNGRVLRGYQDKDGYQRVRIDGIQYRVHRVVCEAFHGPAPDGFEACHGDRDRQNNKASNLRWGTRSDNVQDALAHGTHRHGNPPSETKARGDSSGTAKLTERIVAEARMRHAAGESGRVLAKEYGVTSANMSAALRGKTWAHVGATDAP